MASSKEIAFEIRELGMLMRRKISNINNLGSDNFTGMHTWLIHYLFENDDKDIFQKDVEEMFSIRRSSATSLLQRMEKNDILIRVPVSYDARLKKIVLTEKARTIHREIAEVMTNFENAFVQGLTKDETEQFLSILKKIKNNISS